MQSNDNLSAEYSDALGAEYNKLVSEIIDKMYSATTIELNQIVKGQLFKKVLSDYLGFEVANFYFYEEDEDRLMFFHEALEDGIEMPLFKILGRNPNGTFHSERIDDQDLDLRRKRQTESLTHRGEPLTAMLSKNNLTGSPHRWSSSEEENNWILIPEGEIIIFSFEYTLRKALTESGIGTRADALKALKASPVAQECWDRMHNDPEYVRMAGRERDSLQSALFWLKDVLSNGENYRYLWECRRERKNWFIDSCDELSRLVDGYETKDVDFGVINEFATLIIQNSFPAGTNAQVDLESVRFYERSRISPSLELLHGTHNIVVFLIKFFFPFGLFDEPLKVFLLGTFYDKQLCELHHEEIRNIYSLVTTRDLIRNSMTKLAGTIKTVRKTEEIMATLSGSTFVHELKDPLALIRSMAELLIDKAKKDKGLQSIQNNLSRIRAKAIEALDVLEASRNIAKLALNTKKKLIDLPKVLPDLVHKIREKLEVPDRVTIATEYPDQRLSAYMNETSLNIVLENLIRNAIEAMHGKGHIVIKCKHEKGQVNLSVIDNGPGIDESILPKMFELLSSTKRKEGKGLGLGLYLCKNLIELQGGTITGENLKGGGACFTVSFKAY